MCSPCSSSRLCSPHRRLRSQQAGSWPTRSPGSRSMATCAGTTRAPNPGGITPASADQRPADGRRPGLARPQRRGQRGRHRAPRPPSCSRTRPTPVTTAPTPAATRKTTPATGTTSTPPGPNPQDRLQAHHGPRQGRREQRLRLHGRRAHRQQRDDGRRLRAEQEAVQGLPGRRAAQARPHRRRPADLARVLERRQQPDRDHLRDRQRPNFPSGQTVDFVKVSDATTLGAVRSATNFVDLHEFGLRLHHPCRSTSPRRPSTSRRSASRPACPGFSSGHMRSRTGGSPGQLAAQGHGSAVRHRPQQLRQGHDRQERRSRTTPQDFDLHDDRRRAAGELQTRQRRRRRQRAVEHQGLRAGRLRATTPSRRPTVAGWKLTGLTCDDGNSARSTPARGRPDPSSAPTSTSRAHSSTPSSARSSSRSRPSRTAPPAASPSPATSRAQSATAGSSSLDNLLPGTYTSTENDPAPPFDLTARSPATTATAIVRRTSGPAQPPSVSHAGETDQVHVRQHQAWLDHDHQGRAAQRRPGLRVHDLGHGPICLHPR